jgi:hypothetical protein
VNRKDSDSTPVVPDRQPYSNEAVKKSIETAQRAVDRAERTCDRVARHIRRAEMLLERIRLGDHRRFYLD